jgi:hypothetical protein
MRTLSELSVGNGGLNGTHSGEKGGRLGPLDFGETLPLNPALCGDSGLCTNTDSNESLVPGGSVLAAAARIESIKTSRRTLSRKSSMATLN